MRSVISTPASDPPAPGIGTIAALFAVALLCTALAYLLYFRILATAGATNLMLVTLLIPVGALLLGAIFRGERATGLTLAGLALILAGLAAIDGRLIRRRPVPAAADQRRVSRQAAASRSKRSERRAT